MRDEEHHHLRSLLLVSHYYCHYVFCSRHYYYYYCDCICEALSIKILPTPRLGLPWSVRVDQGGDEAGTKRSAQPFPMSSNRGLRRLLIRCVC